MCTGGIVHDPELRGKGKAIILVVDRDRHIRELESHFLEQSGFSVGFEQTGNGALERAWKVVPDIVITEILVPTLDGLALCRQLKADPRTRHTAVLVFSILAAADRAREAGADAFLLKPLVEHILVETDGGSSKHETHESQGLYMSNEATEPGRLDQAMANPQPGRLATGSRELDAILDGGIPEASINIIMGEQGSGKTILAEEIIFANADDERRPIVYFTTISEPLDKVIKYLQQYEFFDLTSWAAQ
jgi:CheY-like chemotaxis protein